MIGSSAARDVVVFDLDGTLISSAGDLIGGLNAYLIEIGLPPYPVDRPETLIAPGIPWLLRERLASHGRAAEAEGSAFTQHYDAFYIKYVECAMESTRLFPGVFAALDRLAKANFVLAICTVKRGRLARRQIEEFGLGDRFAAVIGAGDTKYLKPDPRHLIDTLSRTGPCRRAWLVGDSETDAATARGAQTPFVMARMGSPLDRELWRTADGSFQNYAEVDTNLFDTAWERNQVFQMSNRVSS